MKSLFKILETGKLIGNYLTGKESSKELEKLKEWVKKENENKKLFNSIKDKKQLASSIKEFEKIDKDAAWEKYIESISKQSKKEMYFRWRVAASVFIVIALSTVALLNYYIKPEPTIAEITHPILPGEPKAFIEFSSGSKFDLQNLDEEQQDKLAKDAGIAVEGNSVINKKEKEIEKQLEWLAITTPRGGEYKMILDDSTLVWLNADSRMEFPNTFSKNERKVKLTGEAYFNVSKDITRPFIVSLNGIDIEVMGTEFNISAYGDDNLIQTTLVEGIVSVKNMLETSHKQNILSPGEQASFNKENRNIEIKKVDVNQYIAWKDGRFVFNYQTLGEITKILGRWYNVDFVFANKELSEIRFSGEFLRYDNIEKIYEIIRKTGTKLEFNQNNGTMEISKAIGINN